MPSRKKAQGAHLPWNHRLFLGLLLFVAAGVVPLVTRLAELTVSPELAGITTITSHLDLFSYHRGHLLLFCAVGVLVCVIFEAIAGEHKQLRPKHLYTDPVFVLVAVYGLFVLLSNVLSNYPHTALWGLHDRNEGLFVQLAYLTVFLGAMSYARGGFQARLLAIALLLASLVMGIFGFSQFVGQDLITADWMVELVGGGRIQRLDPVFPMAYGLSFNPNTFGLITAMLAPLMLAAAVAHFTLAKDRYRYFWAGGFLLAGLLMLLGIAASRSVGGFIGGAAAFVVMGKALVLRAIWAARARKAVEIGQATEKRPFPVKSAVAAGLCLVVLLGTGLVLREPLYRNVTFTLGRIAAIFAPPAPIEPNFHFDGTRITTFDRGTQYTITLPEGTGAPTLAAADGTAIEATLTQAEVQEGTLLVHSFAVPDLGTVQVQQLGRRFTYRRMHMAVRDGTAYLLYIGDRWIDPNQHIPSWGFEGRETWGSNRGFIFARTLPKLPRNLFIGSGSDTFILAFPQHDIVSKARFFGDPYIIVDKAHNLYLQTAVTTGLISALALIGLFGYYIWTTFWALAKGKGSKALDEGESFYFWLRLGTLGAVSAFSVSSLSTDSTLGSTPMFFVILGLGYALNRTLSVKEG